MRYAGLMLLAFLLNCGPSQADGDRACASSDGCVTFGKCWFVPGSPAAETGEQVAGVSVLTQCRPRSARDCESAQQCTPGLSCEIKEDRCVFFTRPKPRPPGPVELPFSCNWLLTKVEHCEAQMPADKRRGPAVMAELAATWREGVSQGKEGDVDRACKEHTASLQGSLGPLCPALTW
jgi:hypothetical protein